MIVFLSDQGCCLTAILASLQVTRRGKTAVVENIDSKVPWQELRMVVLSGPPANALIWVTGEREAEIRANMVMQKKDLLYAKSNEFYI